MKQTLAVMVSGAIALMSGLAYAQQDTAGFVGTWSDGKGQILKIGPAGPDGEIPVNSSSGGDATGIFRNSEIVISGDRGEAHLTLAPGGNTLTEKLIGKRRGAVIGTTEFKKTN